MGCCESKVENRTLEDILGQIEKSNQTEQKTIEKLNHAIPIVSTLLN